MDVKGGNWSVHQEQLSQADKANGVVRKVKVNYMPSIVRKSNGEWYDWEGSHEPLLRAEITIKETGEEIVLSSKSSWQKTRILHCE